MNTNDTTMTKADRKEALRECIARRTNQVARKLHLDPREVNRQAYAHFAIRCPEAATERHLEKLLMVAAEWDSCPEIFLGNDPLVAAVCLDDMAKAAGDIFAALTRMKDWDRFVEAVNRLNRYVGTGQSDTLVDPEIVGVVVRDGHTEIVRGGEVEIVEEGSP